MSMNMSEMCIRLSFIAEEFNYYQEYSSTERNEILQDTDHGSFFSGVGVWSGNWVTSINVWGPPCSQGSLPFALRGL